MFIYCKRRMNRANKIPEKTHKGWYHFDDHPEFKPNLSPREVLSRGAFGGTYWRPIKSAVTKKTHENQHKKYPESWWEGIPEDRLARPIEKYDRKEIHHFCLSKDAVEDVFRTLATENRQERVSNPGLEEARADVIVAGTSVLVKIMRQLGFTECLVSESDILDGILSSMVLQGDK